MQIMENLQFLRGGVRIERVHGQRRRIRAQLRPRWGRAVMTGVVDEHEPLDRAPRELHDQKPS